MISISDLLQPLGVVYVFLLFLLIVLRDKLDRIGPNRIEILIMTSITLLFLMPAAVLFVLGEELILTNPNPLMFGSLICAALAFYSSILIAAFGTRKRVETINNETHE